MQFFKNLRVTIKIWGGFSLIMLTMAFLSAESMITLNNNENICSTYQELAIDSNLASKIQADILLMNIAADTYMQNNSNKALTEYQTREAHLLELLKSGQKAFNAHNRAALIDSIENEVQEMITKFSEYHTRQDAAKTKLEAGRSITIQLDRTLNDAITFYSRTNPQFVQALSSCEIAFTKARVSIVSAMYDPNVTLNEEHLSSLMTRTQEELVIAENFASTSNEVSSFRGCQSLLTQYTKHVHELYKHLMELREIKSDIIRLGHEAADDAEKVTRSIMEDQTVLGNEMEANNITSFNTVLSISCATLLLTLLLSFLTSRSITKPLTRIQGFATALSKGNFSAQLVLNEENEIGEIADALTNMRDAVSSMEQELSWLVTTIASGNIAKRSTLTKLSGDFQRVLDNANNMADTFTHFTDALPLPVLMLDSSLKILYANDLALSLADTTLAACKGKQSTTLFAAEDYQTAGCACTNAIKSKSIQRASTIVKTHAKTLDVDYIAVPTIQDNQVVGVMQVLLDQTDVRGAQRRIQSAAQRIETISYRLKDNSNNLAENFKEVSDGVEIQNQRTAETSTAMEQMNVSVSEVAMNAAKAHTNAQEAKQESENCSAVVFNSVQSITEVSDTTKELQQNTTELSEQVDAISSIMNVISDIADQTNLLALNAAIEAARAGDAGRGFAVVADEVRNLAEKTMQATEEVAQSVSTIQAAAQRNFETVSISAQTVEKANALASESEESLRTIMSLIDQNSTQVGEIATASEEQSAVSEQIARSVEEVADTVHKSAEGISISATSIKEIAEMSNELHDLVEEMTAS
ncbi:methyl-accepting chemotaxis protein [Halodesulfovibrio marinisediminis]|uniref:Methyl-accepting chemotaxis sensory transducer with Pas/Pac sensor n=1 Tax=Halodesulfovibrio marinisediminis DSM 17456 TaxID=1121457 RepID=A0A1N6I4N0_9BACT|nr:HAMP domain-containing methyl-accepting chemotaxis protein [Halodesulfovibrio marinisediminis]SIO26994.1 methyl-accepting chemotaxis sensory transducer with Pas/Pac sensor [Halodesulfovibrio marinisediminis DSM 17456]